MKAWIGIVIVLVVIAGGAFWLSKRGQANASEIEYRYQKVEKGELIRSTQATGVLVALTSVDIRSKAGGKIVRLAVDEGTVVKQGDLIAEIDPEDTRTLYDQASADLTSARARADQARVNAELQVRTSKTSVQDAEVALRVARLRLERAQQDDKSQPQLSAAELQTARAGLQSAQEALRQLREVDHPQQRRDASTAVTRTKSELDTAQAELNRQQELLDKGYVSQAVVDRARSSLESARAASATAVQRLSTLDAQFASELRAAQARVDQAQATLTQAQANQGRVLTTRKSLEEAREAVRQAEIDLQQARDNQLNVQARQADVRSAEASTVRSRVSMQNAKVQLESTRVLAPREGVVTLKYVEEGTIIPAGTSTFSQGTAIVQLSDITRMYADVAVDEADIAQVRVGQRARVILEAYPGKKFRGVVRRISPAAITASNITSVKVRVEVTGEKGFALLPGMTATCEFLTLEKQGVLAIPPQAVKSDEQGTYVRIKGADPKTPARRDVKLGEEGDEGIEVLSGLQPGDEVVIAEINLAELREIQQKMQEAQEGGGLASGGPRPGGARPGGSGGGARSSGGGGGGTRSGAGPR